MTDAREPGSVAEPGDAKQGFTERLGIRIGTASETAVRGHVAVSPEHLDEAGVVHGGVLSSLAETLASWGAYQYAGPRGQIALGVYNKLDVFERVGPGAVVTAIGELVQRSPQQDLWKVTLEGERDGARIPVGLVMVRLQRVPAAKDGSNRLTEPA